MGMVSTPAHGRSERLFFRLGSAGDQVLSLGVTAPTHVTHAVFDHDILAYG